MKIDFSTILLVILVVIPGLFAQKSRDLIAPRSLESQGASTELAELVALGVATHGLLAYLAALTIFMIGVFQGRPIDLFRQIDSISLDQWAAKHATVSVLAVTTYIFFSFFVSHLLGFVYGVWKIHRPLTKWLTKARWLKQFGVQGLFGELPIIYEVLSPEVEAGVVKVVFVELEMKDGLGFYSGQLSQFAFVGDETSHKPVVLINVWFKKDRADAYAQIESSEVMIDLSDVATVLVEQVAQEAVQQENSPDPRPSLTPSDLVIPRP